MYSALYGARSGTGGCRTALQGREFDSRSDHCHWLSL